MLQDKAKGKVCIITNSKSSDVLPSCGGGGEGGGSQISMTGMIVEIIEKHSKLQIENESYGCGPSCKFYPLKVATELLYIKTDDSKLCI